MARPIIISTLVSALALTLSASAHAQTVNQAADFAVNVEGVLISAKYVQASQSEIAVEMDISADGPAQCAAVFAAPAPSIDEGWDAICDNVTKDGEGRFTGRLSRNPGGSGSFVYNGKIEREGTTRKYQMSIVVGADGCPTKIGANTDTNIYQFVDVTACTSNLPKTDETSDPVGGLAETLENFFETREPGPITPDNAEPKTYRYSISEEAYDLSGFLTVTLEKAEADFKFSAERAHLCTQALTASPDTLGRGWARLCSSVARFGENRLTGDLQFTGVENGLSVFEGTVNGREHGFQADVRFAVSNNCVRSIALRGETISYTSVSAICERDEADPAVQSDEQDEFTQALNDFFGGADKAQDFKDKEAGGSGGAGGGNEGPVVAGLDIIPGGNTDRSNTNPVEDTAGDLWPNPGHGYMAKYCHNGDSREDCPQDVSKWRGAVQFSRENMGDERLTFGAIGGCPNFATQTMCALAEALSGQTVIIEDYGYDGKKGIGRFDHDGKTWFVEFSNDAGGLKAELTPATLTVATDLGKAGETRNFSSIYEDYFPAPGSGHFRIFLDERMTLPGRPNVRVQSGDVLLSTGSQDAPSQQGTGRSPGGERLYALDFGQCPAGVRGRFCQSVQANVGGSFPLEDYSFNGSIGTAEMTFGSGRYKLVLKPSEDNSAVHLKMYLIDNPDTDTFTTFLVGREAEGREQDACAARVDVSGLVRLENPKAPNGKPIAICTTSGECADAEFPQLAPSLCEIARWGEVASGDSNNRDLQIWGAGCAIGGEKASSVQIMTLPGRNAEFTDWRYIYNELSSPAVGIRPDGYLRSCPDCRTVSVLYCEPDGPAVFGK